MEKEIKGKNMEKNVRKGRGNRRKEDKYGKEYAEMKSE